MLSNVVETVGHVESSAVVQPNTLVGANNFDRNTVSGSDNNRNIRSNVTGVQINRVGNTDSTLDRKCNCRINGRNEIFHLYASLNRTVIVLNILDPTSAW